MTLTDLDRKKLQLAKLRRAAAQRLRLAFDGENLAAVPTQAQAAVLQDAETLVHWIVASNRSGKTQTGARIVSWWFLENHPHMRRPSEGEKAWRGTLQILVIGRIIEQIESEIWAKKIKPLLPPGSYKEVRTAGVLKRVENLQNGNTIIFLSHHDAVAAREKAQAFTAHVIWLDEMPDHASLITELLMRTLTTDGRMYATFTPLIRNADIYRIVTAPHPRAKQHKFMMLENPKFRGKEAETLEEVRAMCASDAEFRCRAFGEWWAGDTRAFAYDPGRNRVPAPPNYEPVVWRHVAVADPSASGLTGLSVWAEHPSTGAWYNVKAVLIKGTAAYDLFDEIEAALQGFRIVARWTDCNPAGFYKEAARRGAAASGGMPWTPFTDKQDRKVETIDQLNAALLGQKVYLTDASTQLEDDLVRAEWDATGSKIVHASKYHLADTARYFWDVHPKFDPTAMRVRTPDQEIRAAWKARVAREAAAEQAQLLQRKSKWRRRVLNSRSLSLGR